MRAVADLCADADFSSDRHGLRFCTKSLKELGEILGGLCV